MYDQGVCKSLVGLQCFWLPLVSNRLACSKDAVMARRAPVFLSLRVDGYYFVCSKPGAPVKLLKMESGIRMLTLKVITNLINFMLYACLHPCDLGAARSS